MPNYQQFQFRHVLLHLIAFLLKSLPYWLSENKLSSSVLNTNAENVCINGNCEHAISWQNKR